MKKSILAFATLALALLASSCSKEEIIGQNEGLATFKFRVSTGRITKNNVGEINAMDGKTVTVFVRDATTGAVATVIDGDAGGNISMFTLTWNESSSTATTTPAKIYMPTDASLEFVAFAQTTDADALPDFIATGTAPNITPAFGYDGTNLSITGFASQTAKEVVYAIAPVTITSGTATVDFAFNHIVSQVMFAVDKYVDDPQTPTMTLDMVITDLDVEQVPVAGDFSGTATAGSFDFTTAPSTITYDDYALADMDVAGKTANMNSSTATAYTSASHDAVLTRNEDFASFFVLPCAVTGASGLPDESVINITYNIMEGNVALVTGKTATIKFNSLTNIASWAPGKRYIYTFKPAAFISTPTFTITISSWADELEDEIEG